MLAEEFLRRRLDAVHPGAEIDAVQVQGQQLVLGVAGLQIQRQHRFLDLAIKRAAGAEEQVLGQLLRQRRAALHDVPLGSVLKRRAAQPDGINADVMAKAPVLDRDEGVGHVIGQVFGPHHRALRQAAARDLAAAVIQDGDVLRRAADHQVAHIRQAGQEMRKEQPAKDQRPGAQHHQHIGPGGAPLRWRWWRGIGMRRGGPRGGVGAAAARFFWRA